MNDITQNIKAVKPVNRMIYAYTTPNDHTHDGYTKIGDTEVNAGENQMDAVKDRIHQQSGTIDAETVLHWAKPAKFDDDGSGFRDHQFHNYLVNKRGIERKHNAAGKLTEWFGIEPGPAKAEFNDFRENHGILQAFGTAQEYELRAEQKEAVKQTADYYNTHENGAMLWNAKPRFGKTLSVYDFCKKVDAQNVLILTNRPAIADSWYNDYVKFMGAESGYHFVSHVDTIKDKPYVMTREEHIDSLIQPDNTAENCIEFVSLQDLKGAIDFGGDYDKLHEVSEIKWDVLVLDEAHEGVDTDKTDIALNHIKRKFTLNLSGTPFKMLANNEFDEAAIFNWTYTDEQKKKAECADMGTDSPYFELPKLNLFTYQMSEMMGEKADAGTLINDEEVQYYFDLNEFFDTYESGNFVHLEDVKRFLIALYEQTKYPFSSDELRNQLKHTFWLIGGKRKPVDSAKAMKKLLTEWEDSPFKDYHVILAAGFGDDDTANRKAINEVREAIAGHDKTITLSVGQLTTGVTIPEWTAVLMLCSMRSPSLYMQAAFRAQNPCLFTDKDGQTYRKENAYVFDFDPARTLTIIEHIANDQYKETADGRGDSDTRKQHVRELLNFFPVVGEDDNGEMVILDAEKVLSIPRHIHAREVVEHGFMSNFLFQNISGIFAAPTVVNGILTQMEPVSKQEVKTLVSHSDADALDLNEHGEVDTPEEQVIGLAKEKFGNPVFGKAVEDASFKISKTIEEEIQKPTDSLMSKKLDMIATTLKTDLKTNFSNPIVDETKTTYGKDMTVSEKKNLKSELDTTIDKTVDRNIATAKIELKKIEKEQAEKIKTVQSEEEANNINAFYDARISDVINNLYKEMSNLQPLADELAITTVKKMNDATENRKKDAIEDKVRDYLRGFARTIPSFLMAYGTDDTKLETFEQGIPEDVFKDVTSITIDEFRFLRDGGKYKESADGECRRPFDADYETFGGEEKQYAGNLFEPVVFNDACVEFLKKRQELADYFDENQKKDIFDYIPPQRTNQIFTPKKVVKQMVDMFEAENPGCFDDPKHTFADLYMKSGLYITEIIKRLFNSDGMKKAFPNEKERIAHIVYKQVYGAAPTAIIYMIAMHYIFGWEGDCGNDIKAFQKKFPNFVCKDTAELAKSGKLAEWVQETFGYMLESGDEA